MANSFKFFILFIYYVVHIYCTSEICEPEVMTGPPIPTLPKQYYARVEVVLPDMKMSYLAEEYYNYDENKFVLRRHGADNSIIFLDMKNNELFFINPDEKTCYKENDTSSFFDTFLVNLISGQSHILSANQLMNLDPSMFKNYSGFTVERGYQVHQWTFCIDHVTDKFDIRGEVTWYWKGPESKWLSEANDTSFPVKAILKINVISDVGSSTSFNTEMNYYLWSTTITEDLERQITSYLTIPPGIACENKKVTQLFPDLPRKMQLRMDLSIPSEGLISQSDEWYDFDAKIFRVTYRNIPVIGLLTECTLYTYIYDEKRKRLIRRFSDQPIGFCTEDEFIPPNNVYRDTFHYIRMVYYKNFWGTDEVNKKRYSYMGERNETDILCNIWSAVRNDWPDSGVKTAWEWSFSKEPHTAPVKLSIRILSIKNENDFLKQGETYFLNFYEVHTEQNVPDTVYDISECYNYAQKAVAKFTLGGNLNKNIFSYELENALLKKIATTIDINQLRISRLLVRLEEDPVVYFQLLDSKERDINESNLYTSFKNLCHAVQNCKLKTTIRNKYEVWPMSSTLKSTSSKNELNCTLKSTCNYEKFTADVMAGLGIAFLLLGVLFGALVIFIYMHLLKKTKLS